MRQDSGEPSLDIEGLGEQPSIDDAAPADDAGLNGSEEKPNKRRRRGRRGGRRGRDRGRDSTQESAEASGDSDQPDIDDEGSDEAVEASDREESGDQNGTDARTASPSPSRRPRRVWDVPSAANGADDEATEAPSVIESSEPEPQPPVAEEAPPPPAPTAAAPVVPARRRHEIGSSEPRIERVVVGPGEQAAEAESAAGSAPQRKGWWQRKFSGE
jgi:ribonuclease E